MVQESVNPLVSVIIPTFNRAELIRRTVESALNQTYSHLEVIVVDDGSVDNTEAVVSTISDPRVSFVRLPTNCGGAVARNSGIKAATGDYIALLDSDDTWLPNKIELQLASIRSHPCKEQVVSYTQRGYERPWRLTHYPARGKKETESIGHYLFCHDGDMQTSTLMMPRALAARTLFREGLKKHQDWDFCLRLEANNAVFSFIEQPLTIFHNIPRSDKVSRITDFQFSIDWIQRYWSTLPSDVIREFIVQRVFPKQIKGFESRLNAEWALFQVLMQRLIHLQDFVALSNQIWDTKSYPKKLRKKFLKPFKT